MNIVKFNEYIEKNNIDIEEIEKLHRKFYYSFKKYYVIDENNYEIINKIKINSDEFDENYFYYLDNFNEYNKFLYCIIDNNDITGFFISDSCEDYIHIKDLLFDISYNWYKIFNCLISFSIKKKTDLMVVEYNKNNDVVMNQPLIEKIIKNANGKIICNKHKKDYINIVIIPLKTYDIDNSNNFKLKFSDVSDCFQEFVFEKIVKIFYFDNKYCIAFKDHEYHERYGGDLATYSNLKVEIIDDDEKKELITSRFKFYGKIIDYQTDKKIISFYYSVHVFDKEYYEDFKDRESNNDFFSFIKNNIPVNKIKKVSKLELKYINLPKIFKMNIKFPEKKEKNNFDYDIDISLLFDESIKNNNNNLNINNKGWIYLIQKYDLNENRIIYKFGKSSRILGRLKEHGNTSKIIFITDVNDINYVENKILNILKNDNQIICEKNHGNEYFSCPDENYIKDVVVKNVMCY